MALFEKLDDPWAQTLIYEGGAIWPVYTEGAKTMLDVPVKSKPVWKSKIVWTAVGSIVVYVITDLVNMDATTKAAWVTVFGSISAAAVAIMRIWATSTVLK